MFKYLAIVMTALCAVARADVFTARGDGFAGVAWCTGGAYGEFWDPSCTSGLLLGTDEINAAEIVYGGNGLYELFVGDPITGGNFSVLLPGQPSNSVTDLAGNTTYTFSGGTLYYSGGGPVGGFGFGDVPRQEPPGYECVDLPAGGCGLSPGVSLAFHGVFIGDVFVTFTGPGMVTNIHGPVGITVDPSLAAYAGFASTGAFVGEYSGFSPREFYIRATSVPEPAAVVLLLTIIAALFFKLRGRANRTALWQGETSSGRA